jgi:hypothetical protein
MRDASETPSAVGLGVAFGGKSGGKWWDEELVSGSSKVRVKLLISASL